jgi:hypothetical protein
LSKRGGEEGKGREEGIYELQMQTPPGKHHREFACLMLNAWPKEAADKSASRSCGSNLDVVMGMNDK